MSRRSDLGSMVSELVKFLAAEGGALGGTLGAASELCRSLQSSSQDPRLRRLGSLLAEAAARREGAEEHARQALLAPLAAAAKESAGRGGPALAGAVLARVLEARPGPARAVCEALLDALLAENRAARGFVVLFHPESTEAEIVCARNYSSENLSLEEHRPSRSVLRELLERPGPVRLEDAATEGPGPGAESVWQLGLRSVVAAPIGQPPLGALYLEDGEPGRFSAADAEGLAILGRWAAFHLRQAHLLPAGFRREERVFLDARRARGEIVGRDPRILELLHLIRRVADGPATVLLQGESGTGKDLLARALHYESSRRDRPFVAINCAAVPETLFESELFGHERGAFTGADRRHPGRLEQADGGTVFLDEIGEMPYPLQAKLLRFLQSQEVTRLGGTETFKVDVRVVAATSHDLGALAEEGRFQRSLFFRLNVIPIEIPALRERPGDVPILVEHFLRKYGTLYQREVRFSREAFEALAAYDFPGNVRELENLVHRLVAVAEGDLVGPGDLPREVAGALGTPFSVAAAGPDGDVEVGPGSLDAHRAQRERLLGLLAGHERRLAERAVAEAGGSVTRAAELLGVHRVTLHRMLRRGGGGGESPPGPSDSPPAPDPGPAAGQRSAAARRDPRPSR
ncbi:MAG TPA: sigma 54-interacting transcriptional regulator [Thermoanaerobaculia bacterium]|nr:sigma 54-interacting transcriptional regulator [Thermoanaerobaculia bacterium]